MNVLVTGATGALGTAVTKTFMKQGHNVTATWLHEKEALQLEREIGDRERLSLVEANVLDPTAMDQAVRSALTTFGDIHALVHLVGSWLGNTLVHEHDLTHWQRMIDLNLTSAFVSVRAVLPVMRANDRGRIVLVSSRTAVESPRGQVGYAVAKAGLRVLAEAITEETAGTNVTANVVAPSVIDTPATRAAMPDADRSNWVSAEDLASSIAFLASEEATALRGAWLPT